MPPPMTFMSPSRPSNSDLLSLLQVNLVLGDGRSLGLTIRGGAEYGLGIYVTGVDLGSEAESSGLKVSSWTHTGGDGRQGCMHGAEGGKELCVELFAADFRSDLQRGSQHPRPPPAPAEDWSQPGAPLAACPEQAAGACPHLPSPPPSSPRSRAASPTCSWAAGQLSS